MAYDVEIARRAEADLEELYLWVVARAPQQGAKWFNGLERAVLSLDQHPKRCPVAPESLDSNRPVRVLSYGRTPHVYRIFFIVDDEMSVVQVVHVRRGARERPMADELSGNLDKRDQAREQLRADAQADVDQLPRPEGRAYDKTSGRQLADRIKSHGRAARTEKS